MRSGWTTQCRNRRVAHCTRGWCQPRLGDTHDMTPLDCPTSLRTTRSQTVCQLPVSKEKLPRPSDVP